MNDKAVLAIALQKAKASLHNVNTILRGLEKEILPPRVADINRLIGGISPTLPLVTEEGWTHAIKLLERNDRFNISAYPLSDSNYPPSLRLIPTPPSVLYARGNTSLLAELPGVAVVGTRKATENGLEISRRIASFLAERGWVVVSGLALGIDAAAHEGALKCRGKTIAVLAHGLQAAFPKKNAKLAEEILDANGAWVSEYPVGVEPRPQYFPLRNRIQIGLSAGSVIIEADLKSGSVIQAEYTVGQRRLLFAVVPEDESNPLGLFCRGTKMLVSQMNAVAIRSKADYPSVVEKLTEGRIRIHALK